LTPGLRIRGEGGRVKLNGTVALQALLYVRTGDTNNRIFPLVNLNGNAELIEKFFYLDGAINVSQQFLTPFGATPPGAVNATNNRYTSSSYRLSPYIQGTGWRNITYLLRDDNIWTTLSGAPISLSNAYYNNLIGRIASPINPYGWALEYNRNNVEFNNQPPLTTEVARARLIYNVGPSLQISAIGGYEQNNYYTQDTSYSGPIYGAGLRWRPTPRTDLFGEWEERFFGPSYRFAFSHRRPLSAFNIEVSRGITTYPQQLAALPAGANTAAALDAIFQTRIPDTAERAQFVDQLLTSRGLPSSLTNPVALYTQQILLFQRQSATFALTGVRNTLSFNVFNLKQEPVSGAGTPLPPGLFIANNNTQTGGSITLTHSFTPQLSLNGLASYTYTEANPPQRGDSSLTFFRVALTQQLSAKTNAFLGARYQIYRSDITNITNIANPSGFFSNYNEAAAFVGIDHRF